MTTGFCFVSVGGGRKYFILKSIKINWAFAAFTLSQYQAFILQGQACQAIIFWLHGAFIKLNKNSFWKTRVWFSGSLHTDCSHGGALAAPQTQLFSDFLRKPSLMCLLSPFLCKPLCLSPTHPHTFPVTPPTLFRSPLSPLCLFPANLNLMQHGTESIFSLLLALTDRTECSLSLGLKLKYRGWHYGTVGQAVRYLRYHYPKWVLVWILAAPVQIQLPANGLESSRRGHGRPVSRLKLCPGPALTIAAIWRVNQ